MATEMKEIRLGRSVKFDPHDVQVRIDQSRRFLMHGHKVMVTQKFKGREIAHKEIGLSNLRDVADALADVAKVEQTPRWMGKQASIILSPDKVKVEAVKRRLEKEKAEKIAAGAVLAEKIAKDAITTEKLINGGVTTDKLAAGGVTAFRRRSFPSTEVAVGGFSRPRTTSTPIIAGDLLSPGTTSA
jgi:hypothetical protein